MHPYILCLLLWLGVSACASASALAATRYSFDNDACPFRGKDWFDPERMDCGTVVAAEPGVDVAIRVPALRLLRRDATSREAPVVFVNGGPGGRGIADVGDWLAHPLRERHDLILFDARGTGQSTPLPCPELGAEVLSLIARDIPAAEEARERTQRVRRCLTAMPAPLRGVFATPQMAQDIDAIRRMFGYERVSLFAVSYGTRVATAYAAAHPGHLDRLVLDSVAPEHAYYPGIAGNFDAALERAFAGCEASPACRARFPQFRRHYREVMATLRARPIRLHLPGGRYPDDTVSLNAEDFTLLVQQSLYGDELIPTLPLMIEELRGGNTAPLALLFEVAVGMRVSGLNFATYYLVLGNDEWPRVQAELRPAPAPGALAFFAQDLQLLDALGLFDGDPTPFAADPPTGPVLVVAGALDPITAPGYGRALAQRLPQARHLEIPASGHTPSLADDCARASMVAFLSGDDRPLACTRALPSVAWAGDVYRSAWPRNWLEAIVLPRSTLPLLWFGLVAALYALLVLGLPVAAGYRRLRGRRTPAEPMHPLDRRARTLGLSAMVAGIVVLGGLCALLASTVTGAAPASLLFGLPVAAYALAALAASLVLLTVLSVFALVRAWRHGSGRQRFHLWLACIAAVNLGLVGFLLRWQVFLPA